MSIRRRKDGAYVIRYYAHGTKNSPQRQETLRGVTDSEAVRIYEERLAAASSRKPKVQRANRKAASASDAEARPVFTREEWERFVRAFDDDAAWRRHAAEVRHLGPVKVGVASLKPRRYGGGRRPDSEATAAYRNRLRTTLPLFAAVLQTGCTIEAIVRKTGRPDGSAFSVREVQRAFSVASRVAGLRKELTPKSLRRSLASWPASQSDRLREAASNPWRVLDGLRVSLLDRVRQVKLASASLEHHPDSVEQLPRTGVAQCADQRADQRGGQMKGTRRILVTAIVLVAGVALGAGFLTMKRASGPTLARVGSAPSSSVATAAAPKALPAPAPEASASAAVEPAPRIAEAATPGIEKKVVRKAAHALRPVRASSGGPAAALMAGPTGVGGEEPEKEFTKEELAALWPYKAGDAVVPVLSPELRDIPVKALVRDPGGEVENRNLPTRGHRVGDAPSKPDTAIQQIPGPSLLTPTGVNFEGLPANGSAPPDNDGRVGPNHFVQWINSQIAIYDKSGTILYGPSAGNTLFTALGGVCSTINDGDPLVVYDPLADRWLLTQFIVEGPPTGQASYQCTAVSVTGDPLGAYYLYAFPLSPNQFWDYPHTGVWPDSYYATYHVFTGLGTAFLFQGLAAFERGAMIAGLPARVVTTPMDLTQTYFGALPADLDGLTPPPPASPEYIFAPGSNEWDGTTAPGSATLHVWTAATTWGATPATVLTGPTDMAGITVFNSDMCDFARNCVPEPAVSAANFLDAVSGRMMNRVAYRNFGAFESIMLSHTVNTFTFASPQTLNQAAPRWYEVRLPGGVPTISQQGTYSPDSDHRWMGSVAMDNSGNIALGYSKSSTTTLPEIDVVGRLSTDAPGTLGTETVMKAGGGVQTGTANRWGDYTAMSVDPRDGCTFWYTNQYQAANGTFNWRTRIGSFRFGPSECSPPAKGTLTGTVKDGAGLPIAGALVTLDNGFSGGTNALGIYSIVLPPGTVNATASAPLRPGCTPSASSAVTITNGAVTTKNFVLTGTASLAFGTASIDDSGGNNNGVINRNECVVLNLSVENIGCAVASGISGVLSTSTPGVTITQNTSGYTNLAPGATGSNLTPFKIATSPSFVCGTPIDFTLTVTSSAGVTPFGFSLPTCQGATVVQSGSITNADTTETARMGRTAVPSSCSGKACPGPLGSGTRHYDAFNFTNIAPSAACINVTLGAACISSNGDVFSVAYLGSFDPTNLCLNYAGDVGGSPTNGNSASYSFTVPAGGNFVVVVNESTSGAGCASYTLSVDGLLDNSDAGRPAAPTAGNNGPICEGSTLNLTATTVGGATYSWTGPNGFTSTAQNPTIPSATPAASGTYTVVATIGGCSSDPATTSVTVNAAPSAAISAPSQVCAESTTNVASVPDAGLGAAYVWTITNGVITAGAGTPSITFTANPSAGPITLGVTVQNAAGCLASGSATVAISATCGNFFTLTPCRLIDTRSTDIPSLVAGATRTFIVSGNCNVPSTAQSVSINVAVTGETNGGNLQIFAGGSPVPTTATINYNTGQTRSNNAIVTLGPGGTITVKCNQGAGTTDLVLDVNGYFE